MKAILVLGVLALIAITYVNGEASAQVKFVFGNITGDAFFVQESAAAVTEIHIRLTGGYTLGTIYKGFIHDFGDSFDGTNYGGCSITASSFIAITPNIADVDDQGHYRKSYTSTVVPLGGSNSIIGRQFVLYDSPVTDTCSWVSSLTPVAQGTVGIAWMGAGKGSVDNEAWQPLTSNPVSGYCRLFGTTGTYGDNSGISGSVYFEALTDGRIYVLVQATGITTGLNANHALHVHEFGDLSLSNATSMNLHWNPYGGIHAFAPSTTRHAGDIGNIMVSASGTITHQGAYNLLTFQGAASFIGRGVVLHTLSDDGNPTNITNSVGAAGGRIARGVIGISNRAPPLPWVEPSSSAATPAVSSSGGAATGTGATGTTATTSSGGDASTLTGDATITRGTLAIVVASIATVLAL